MSRDLQATIAYRVLESGPRPADQYVMRASGLSAQTGEVLFGIDSEERRHLLIPLARTAIVEDRRSAGVQIYKTELNIDGTATAFADVVCLKNELSTVFEVFVEEVLDAVEASAHPSAVAVNVLDKWRQLLEAGAPGMLSKEKIAGVIGEMVALRDLSTVIGGVTSDSWVGPENHRHDIIIQTGSVEVKTTRSPTSHAVTIHGLEQLEPISESALLVALVRLVPHPEGSLSVPTMLDQLVKHGFSSPEIRGKLNTVGIGSADLDRYRETRFELESVGWYDATESNFPRSVSSSIRGAVPPGIDAVTYRLDLSAAPVAPIALDEAARRLTETDAALQ